MILGLVAGLATRSPVPQRIYWHDTEEVPERHNFHLPPTPRHILVISWVSIEESM